MLALSKCSRELWLSFCSTISISLSLSLPLPLSLTLTLFFSSIFHLTISLFLTLALKIKIIEWSHSFLNQMYRKPEKQRWYVNLKKKRSMYLIHACTRRTSWKTSMQNTSKLLAPSYFSFKFCAKPSRLCVYLLFLMDTTIRVAALTCVCKMITTSH